MARISPRLLSKYLGQEHAPTEQQEAIIGAAPGPLLVVAGAGAGKTETMAARVVWLVANGFVAPDQVLGLTFTRKAAQQLSQRIRHRLETLAGIPRLPDLDPSGELANNLQVINPTVSTYDSYAGSLIREYGLLLPVEPSARLITHTELYHIARMVVDNYRGELSADQSPATVTQYVLSLISEMDNHMVSPEEIAEETHPFVNLFDELPKAKRQRDELNATMQKWRDTQILRLQFLPLASAVKQELHQRSLITFGEQMSKAAQLAARHPQVGYSQRRRFRVIMLDEYQDTSHAQRILLRSLFGGSDPGLSVTAVGDPMQAIYGWRGATAANLQNFVADFPVVRLADPEPAPKKELTISWRNPPEVLTLANTISRVVLGAPTDPKRSVQPLQPRIGAPAGDVSIGWFSTMEEERSFVANKLQEHWLSRSVGFTAAVLVRKRKHSQLIANELRDRGIPVEIVGLSGLLDVPEVADLIAIATMLVRPQDNSAALRILGGPHVGLGIADIEKLQQRARNLARRVHHEDAEQASDPLERLTETIAATTPLAPEEFVGLVDAIADLGEANRYSAEGYSRLRRLSGQLRHLRLRSLGRSVVDLFADIEDVFGIRTEVLARENPYADGAAGTVHLNKFAAEIADHASSSLPELLDYFTLARSQEDGLEPGEVSVLSDRVQILTVHKAKGLEWDIVSVLHADAGTYDASASTFLSNVTAIPATLRGDSEVGAPILDTSDVNDRKEFEQAGKDYIDEVRAGLREENSRLFYVGITRSERVLLVTGSAIDDDAKKPKSPYVHLAELRDCAPEAVVQWWEGGAADVDKLAPPSALYPTPWLTPEVAAGAELVRAAQIDLPQANTEGGLETLWESEVTALIDEQHRLATPIVNVEISRELSATDLVALKNNPDQFARRLRRPVPFKPSSYAKRGTQFHQWIEDRYGSSALLDEDQLPGNKEEVEHNFAELKEAFLRSSWAKRTPTLVEHPFEVVIGTHVIRGRMDAVFHEPDGTWYVVDWKTGRKPTGDEMAAAIIQLAVYRIALARLRATDPKNVRAAFHYVAENFTFEPASLPTADELALLIDPDEGIRSKQD